MRHGAVPVPKDFLGPQAADSARGALGLASVYKVTLVRLDEAYICPQPEHPPAS